VTERRKLPRRGAVAPTRHPLDVGDLARGAYAGAVSEQETTGPVPARSLTLDDLARLQGAKPVEDLRELAGDFWESDEEVGEFLADLRASRNASLT
jgi:hypothetical protein